MIVVGSAVQIRAVTSHLRLTMNEPQKALLYNNAYRSVLWAQCLRWHAEEAPSAPRRLVVVCGPVSSG